ncbi:MAG: family 10 glycosylhydrolase, partial [Bacteroidota bacterium]
MKLGILLAKLGYKNYRGISFLLIVFFTIQVAFSQSHPPKREFRGTWIATVNNIDWPSRRGLSTEKQQAELRKLLDQVKGLGLNAVIFQARPSGEVLYNSPYEPWSTFLTGQMGQAPDPYYDPLSFAIEEAHKRGLDFHVWVNPFRLNTNWSEDKELPSSHAATRHPSWTIPYGRNLYLDPGNPEAREFILKVVVDLVKRYEIDALHFDDYFYPYKIQGESFADSSSYLQYNRRQIDLEDWRRENISTFVKAVSDSIYLYKPFVEFGISPFGVWRNQSRDPRGSQTRSLSSYDDLYADILFWIERGWIDYVAPQLYWSRGYAPADFSHLLDWWSSHSEGVKLYIGQALYKINNNSDKNWENPSEVPDQLRSIRQNRKVSGSIFYSSKWFGVNPLGVADSLQEDLYYYPSLTPKINRSEILFPQAPFRLETDSDPEGIAMIWEDAGEEGSHKYFVIYRSKGKKIPLSLPEFQQAIIRSGDLFFLDRDTKFLR